MFWNIIFLFYINFYSFFLLLESIILNTKKSITETKYKKKGWTKEGQMILQIGIYDYQLFTRTPPDTSVRLGQLFDLE